VIYSLHITSNYFICGVLVLQIIRVFTGMYYVYKILSKPKTGIQDKLNLKRSDRVSLSPYLRPFNSFFNETDLLSIRTLCHPSFLLSPSFILCIFLLTDPPAVLKITFFVHSQNSIHYSHHLSLSFFRSLCLSKKMRELNECSTIFQ
jgi:hypothetical protein